MLQYRVWVSIMCVVIFVSLCVCGSLYRRYWQPFFLHVTVCYWSWFLLWSSSWSSFSLSSFFFSIIFRGFFSLTSVSFCFLSHSIHVATSYATGGNGRNVHATDDDGDAESPDDAPPFHEQRRRDVSLYYAHVLYVQQGLHGLSETWGTESWLAAWILVFGSLSSSYALRYFWKCPKCTI